MNDFNKYLESIWQSITYEFYMKFIVVYLFIVWISLVAWVLKDIRNRSSNTFFQIFCVLIPVLLTPLGIFIYLLIRPSRTLYERYYEEIEENLEIINEIIEERKQQFEQKINKSLEKEVLPKKEKKIEINYIYETNIIKEEKKEIKSNDDYKVKKDIKITQLKKKRF